MMRYLTSGADLAAIALLMNRIALGAFFTISGRMLSLICCGALPLPWCWPRKARAAHCKACCQSLTQLKPLAQHAEPSATSATRWCRSLSRS